MAWKLFEARKLAPASMAAVSIQGGGRLNLNRKAHELLLSGAHGHSVSDVNYVALMYDATRHAIGMRVSERANNTYPLRKQPRSESYLVSARAFLQDCQIEMKSQRYEAQLEGDILVVVLDKARKTERTETKKPRQRKGH